MRLLDIIGKVIVLLIVMPYFFLVFLLIMIANIPHLIRNYR